MTIAQQVKAALEHVTYRDGWKFRVDEGSPMYAYQDGALVITVSTPDSYHPANIVQIHHRYPLVSVGEDEIPRWIFHCITTTETHEAREWFRFDGVVLYDPHAAP